MFSKEIKQQSRSKNSIYNAITAVSLTIVNGLFGIILTNLIIRHYGSDFNGLNSTANQIVNVLLILEGGFTLASNVMLFGPVSREEKDIVNGILFTTRKKFKNVAAIFWILGLIVSIAYSFLVKSNLQKELIFSVVFMAIVPAGFNLFYAATYRVYLQALQKEYIINLITITTIGLGYITNIIIVIFDGPIWSIRTITMIFALCNSIIIGMFVRKRYKIIINKDAKKVEIKGTFDVMVQKITGVIYNSAPMIFLTVFPTGGTVLASVYAVYNNVFLLLKSLLHGIIDAPRLSFGQLISEKKEKQLWEVFKEYEIIVFLALFTLMVTGYVLILPFIKVYTMGVKDVNYYDPLIALMLTLIGVFEMLHIPSGHIINMAGLFKVSRNIQVAACIILVVSMTIVGNIFGVYGLLASVLFVAIFLAIMEIVYVHLFYFKKKLGVFIIALLPYSIVGVLSAYIESMFCSFDSYTMFFVYGLIYFTTNACLALVITRIFHKEVIIKLKNIMKLLRFRNL